MYAMDKSGNQNCNETNEKRPETSEKLSLLSLEIGLTYGFLNGNDIMFCTRK